MSRLLSGTNIDVTQRPSIVLARLKEALGPSPSESDCKILRSIWLQKLPARTREFLIIYQDDPLDKQANVADRLFEQYEKPSSAPTASVSAVSSGDNMNASQAVQPDMVLALLRNLTLQVAEIRAERSRERSRGNSCLQSRNVSPSNYNRYRSRGNSPHPGPRSTSRPRRPDWYDGKCWYHAKFGEKARNCVSGCSSYSRFSSSVSTMSENTD
jgi:hypothetical protein